MPSTPRPSRAENNGFQKDRRRNYRHPTTGTVSMASPVATSANADAVDSQFLSKAASPGDSNVIVSVSGLSRSAYPIKGDPDGGEAGALQAQRGDYQFHLNAASPGTIASGPGFASKTAAEQETVASKTDAAPATVSTTAPSVST
jgi:hypothetical protein